MSKYTRTESSLPPEFRCEQIEDREREHWTESKAYGTEPTEKPKGEEENE